MGNSPSEEEMGHWTPTGIEPRVYDDDVRKKFQCDVTCFWTPPSVTNCHIFSDPLPSSVMYFMDDLLTLDSIKWISVHAAKFLNADGHHHRLALYKNLVLLRLTR